jgi:Ser/Thr protein kinase RdoA (MazF antagonist)
VPKPWVGATSHVYPVGAAVIKVPRSDPTAIAALRTDAVVGQFARQWGVRTPRLRALDDALDLLPVPFAIWDRVPGRSLGELRLEPATIADAWRELGRDLALVHTRGRPEGALAGLRTFSQSGEVDPRPWVDSLASAGLLTADETRWLFDVLEHLAPAALAPVPRCCCHGDVNAANVLASPVDRTYLGMVDWAGAGWLDPVWDFAGVPLAAVPLMLDGHRREAPLPSDDSAEARIVWCHLQLRLLSMVQRKDRVEAIPREGQRMVAEARSFAARSGLAALRQAGARAN